MESNLYTDDLNYNIYLLLIAADQIHDFWSKDRAFKAFRRNGYIAGGSKQHGGAPPIFIFREYDYFINKILTEPFKNFPIEEFLNWGLSNGVQVDFNELGSNIYAVINKDDMNAIKTEIMSLFNDKIPQQIQESMGQLLLSDNTINYQKLFETLSSIPNWGNINIQELEQKIEIYNRTLSANNNFILSYLQDTINNMYNRILNIWGLDKHNDEFVNNFSEIKKLEELFTDDKENINIDGSNIEGQTLISNTTIINIEVNSLPNIILEAFKYIKHGNVPEGTTLLEYLSLGPNGDGQSLIELLEFDGLDPDEIAKGIKYYFMDIIEKINSINKLLIQDPEKEYNIANGQETNAAVLAILFNILFLYYPIDDEDDIKENGYMYCLAINIFVDIFSANPVPFFIKPFVLYDNSNFIQILIDGGPDAIEHLKNSGYIDNPDILYSMILTIVGIFDIEDYGSPPEYEGMEEKVSEALDSQPIPSSNIEIDTSIYQGLTEQTLDSNPENDPSFQQSTIDMYGGTKRTKSSEYLDILKKSAKQLYSDFLSHPIIKKRIKKRKNLKNDKTKVKLWLSYLGLLRSTTTYFLTKFALPNTNIIKQNPLIIQLTNYIEKFKLKTTVTIGTGKFEENIFTSIKDYINNTYPDTVKKHKNVKIPNNPVTIDPSIIARTKILNNATSLNVLGEIIPNFIQPHDPNHTDPNRITDGQDKTECEVSSIVDPQRAYGFNGNTCDFSQGNIKNAFGTDIHSNFTKQIDIVGKSIDNGIKLGIRKVDFNTPPTVWGVPGTYLDVFSVKNTLVYDSNGGNFNIKFKVTSNSGGDVITMNRTKIPPFTSGYSGDKVISLLYDELRNNGKVKANGMRTFTLLNPSDIVSILLLKTFGDTSQELVGTMWNQLININSNIVTSGPTDPSVIALATERGVTPQQLHSIAQANGQRLHNSIPAFFANDYLSVARNIFTNTFFNWVDPQYALYSCNMLEMYSGFCSSTPAKRPKPTVCPNNNSFYYCSNDPDINQCSIQKYMQTSICPDPPQNASGTLYLYKSEALKNSITGGKNIKNNKKTFKRVKKVKKVKSISKHKNKIS
jgi:hypothetical protein